MPRRSLHYTAWVDSFTSNVRSYQLEVSNSNHRAFVPLMRETLRSTSKFFVDWNHTARLLDLHCNFTLQNVNKITQLVVLHKVTDSCSSQMKRNLEKECSPFKVWRIFYLFTKPLSSVQQPLWVVTFGFDQRADERNLKTFRSIF